MDKRRAIQIMTKAAEIYRDNLSVNYLTQEGNNMPDLDTLIEMADYYEIDLRELLAGERKSEKMNEELKETVLKVAEYSNSEKRSKKKKNK